MSTVSTEGTKPGNVAQLITRMSQHQHQILGASRPEVSIRKDKHVPSIRPKFYQARFSYKAMEDDELTFGEGAYIEHIEDIEDGWKRGRLLDTGRIGAFPENFVQQCEPPVKNHAVPSASTTTGPTDPLRVATSFDSKPHSTSGNGNGSSSKAHALASKAVRTSLVDSMQASGSDAAVVSTATAPSKLIKERALVKYSYTSSQEDELDLTEGTYITVINKHTSDADWYEGEYNGRRGLFPSNHVQIVVANEKTVLPSVPTASGTSGPPTPPPIKPKPAGSTPLGFIATTPPPATSTTTTPPSGGSNVKLLRQQVFGNMPPPKPGDKPNFGRPKTTVFENINFGPSESEESSVTTTSNGGPGGDAEPLRHLNRERPKQAKRPPSMKPFNSTEIEPPTSTSSVPTTSFPAKEPLPAIVPASTAATAASSRQSVLIPKKDSPEISSKGSSGSDKPFRYHTTHTETVLSPTKSKPSTPISTHYEPLSNETPVSRTEFNELKALVERLARDLRELRDKKP